MNTAGDRVKRPILRYHSRNGGKWKLAPWVISHFPHHRIYVESYAGAASVLLRKPRSHAEVYNDLDGEVVNVFRVLQDPATAEDLRRRLTLTPFSRKEFKRAYEPPVNDIDRAQKMLIRAFMGFGSASMTRMHVTGFRSNASRNGATPALDWSRWPDQVPAFIERLRAVVIEDRDALLVMDQHDSPQTLFYVDPPYVQETRTSLKNRNGNRGHCYRHDMDDGDHVRLAKCLHSLKGMVVLSGYNNPMYAELYVDWQRRDVEHMADGARRRVESVWLNPACVAAQSHSTVEMELGST